MSKLIFGCGYLGKRVGKLWVEQGEHVLAVSRNENRGTELGMEGFFTIQADVTKPETLGFISELPRSIATGHASQQDLRDIDTVLFAVGFDRTIGNTLQEVYADGVKNVLAALPSSVERFIYISTTGVYGPADGNWVDENTTPNPQRDGGKASLAAEHCFYEKGLGPNAILLRLAGIYGPDRIPYLAKLRAGEPIAAPSQGWLNLIHVDDAAKIVLAAEAWSSPHQTSPLQQTGPHTFCVSDGHPVIRGDYYREVARRIGAAPPQFTTPDPAYPAAARAASDKRISNAKLCQELNFQFNYPSYHEGLAAIL